MSRITLNVGGIRFETEAATLKRFPNSKLSRECQQLAENKEVFFDRNPYIFSFILDSYRYGSIHVPHDVCSSYLQAEIEFWELPINAVQPCCLKAFYGHDDDIEDIEALYHSFPHFDKFVSQGEALIEVHGGSKALRIWNFVNDAKSSRKATIYAIMLFCCTMGTILIEALQSVGIFREDFMPEEAAEFIAARLSMNSSNPKLKFLTTQPTVGAKIVNLTLGATLCIDTLLRLIFSPDKRQYLKSLYNIADIIHLVGFILVHSLFGSGAVDVLSESYVLWIWLGLGVMDCFRVVRLLRLGLNIAAVRLMQISLLSSCSELGFLFMCVLTFMSLLGPLVLLVEFDTDGNINDFFTSFWWALVTMTTVGYGDHYPVSSAGRLVGVICAVLGVLLLSMPIGILASSFNDKHSNYKLVDKHCQRRRNNKESTM